MLPKQQNTILEAGPPLLGLDEVDTTARERFLEVEEAIRFLYISMLENMTELISNNSLNGLRHIWLDLYKFRFQRGRLHLLFSTVLQPGTNALNNGQPVPLPLEVAGADKNGIIGMRRDPQPALSSSYGNLSLRLSPSGWAVRRLCMKRRISGEKGATYNQSTLNNRKPTKTLLETEAGTSLLYIKEEDILNDISLAPLSTLRKEEKTAISRLIKKMSSVCFNEGLDFTIFMEEQDLGV